MALQPLCGVDEGGARSGGMTRARLTRSAESLAVQARVPIRENGEPLVDFVGLSPRLRFAERHPVYDLDRAHLARRRVA
jgi:hypothetical protein